MVKPKPRKTRLDKGGGEGRGSSSGTDFIGFGAFAAPAPAAAAAATWSPVYTGKNEQFASLFPRFQKRDAVTVSKCLLELNALFASDSSITKRAQAEALWHYAWLYHSKLAMDGSGAVRAAAASIWMTAYHRIPKAVGNILSQYPELLGILYATQTDPSSEVRSSIPLSDLLLQQADWPWQTGLLAYTGRILSYGRASVLHDALFATKQQQRSSSKSSSSAITESSSDNNNKKNEQNRDAMEERFERLVGNCLDALSMWIQERGGCNDIPEERSTVWWKTLQSPKHNLRRKTYHLLSVVVVVSSSKATAAPHNNHLVVPANLDAVLPQAVASEKEAVNIPILLETILTVLVHHHQQNNSNETVAATSNEDGTLPSSSSSSTSTASLVKPISRVLKKACYGAKVDLWGPILLPLVAQFDDDDAAASLQLLQAAYDGLSVTLGEMDQWPLLTAIAESASFLLLRRRRANTAILSSNDDGDSPTTAGSIAHLWLRTLTDTLSTTTTTTAATTKNKNAASTPASMARDKLLRDLAKQLLQFDEATSSNSCAFYSIADWFWGEGLDFAESQPQALARLVQELQKLRHAADDAATNMPDEKNGANGGSSGFCSRLVPKLRQRLRHVLSQYQQSSGAVPTESAYQLIQAVFDYCGPLSAFEQQQGDGSSSVAASTLEKFVMNDLLRWTVIHSSTLSTTTTTTTTESSQQSLLVEQDFCLLSTCLAALEKRHLLWDSFLREIIAAKCSLEFLSAGLRTLVYQNNDASWVVCETLDNFAIQIAHLRINEERTLCAPEIKDDISDDESLDTTTEKNAYETELDFYSTCIGTVSEASPTLVGDRVLLKWIEHACSPQDASREITSIHSVLEVLLQVVQKKRSLLSSEQVDRILTESWRCPDRLYEVYTSDMLSSDSSLRDHFMSIASQELRQDLARYVASTCSADKAKVWSMRTWRILRTCKNSDQVFPSLRVGTEDIDFWRKNARVMFDLSMALFHITEVPSDRLALVESWCNSDPSEFLCSLLISLSEASRDPVAASKPKERRDRCALFLAAIGGKSLDTDFVEGVVRAVISRLCSDLKGQVASLDETIRRGTAVLSQLVDLLFARVLPSGATELAPEDILEGARLWYIVDTKEPSVREEATVVKVHYDSQAGYYYTIEIPRDGVSQERQTILGRLRKDQNSDSFADGISEDDISSEEWAKRSNVRNLVVQNLILPYFSIDNRLESLGELVNIVVCQLGVGNDRGLGSPHYDIHRCVSAMEEGILTALNEQETQLAADRLWMLSLALGFGLNIPSSKWTMKEVRVNPIPSYRNLLDYYAGKNIGAQPQLDCAVLAWLIVSLRTALEYQEEAGSAVFQSLMLLFRIAGHVLEQGHDEGSSMIACRAVYEGMMLSTQRWCKQMQSEETFGPQLFQAKEKALSNLVGAFADKQQSETHLNGASVATSRADWISCSPLSQLLTASHQTQSMLESLASASSIHISSLTRALFDPRKRNLAFLLVNSIAARETPLHKAEDEIVLSDQTSRRLKAWTDGLEEEEAAELEEDIYIVSEWVPANMMNELESWREEGFEEFDESTIVGRLMVWVSFLRFIDSASPRDFRNRPAFVSYLVKCGAVSPILTLGILHDEAINDPKRKTAPPLLEMGDLLKNESFVDMTQLASLSLFRTVEVLPSLSRRWWEEECPKVYSNAVQLFVEKQVSPEILKRELERIKSRSFGPMTVTASLISREVTATYVQDDFSLSVVISLPAAFPFRSAEVDCSKTLGVPQSRWKRWALQITLILNNQGGTLQDALMLWKDNVDKEFEGVEPCPVCYSVLHVKTHKLPSLECKTCQNRFHLDCLTQWFRSSGKSQCVLCQQPWQGSRIQ